MPAIVAFTGLHNSGKTTVARKVISELRSMGYRSAVIKSTSHKDIEKEMDRPGTDTALYRKDGVEAVAIMDSDNICLFQDMRNIPVKDMALRLFYDFDLVVLEGFKNILETPKIEVVRKSLAESPLYRDIDGIEAVVSDDEIHDLRPGQVWFSKEKIRDISLFIEKRYIKPSIRSNVRLYVNGNRIETNRFVTSALAGTIKGFISSLKGTGDAEQIDISFRTNGPLTSERKEVKKDD